MIASAQSLLLRHQAAWLGATRHPFLEAVRTGHLPPGAFQTWLVQDYLFVRDLLRFQGHLVGRAPREAQAVLAAGLLALESELTWFENQSEQRNFTLDVPRHPVTAAYNEFLCGLDSAPYPAAIVALWAVERAYLEAWTGAAPGHPDYRDFVEHWTVPPFAEYVAGLESAADAALRHGEHLAAAEQAFLAATTHERSFWEMAWSTASERRP